MEGCTDQIIDGLTSYGIQTGQFSEKKVLMLPS